MAQGRAPEDRSGAAVHHAYARAMSTNRHHALAVVATVLVACGAVPTATSSPTGTPSPGVSQAATPFAPPATTVIPSASSSVSLPDASWTEVAVFGTDGGIERVLDVADTPFGFIAVGEMYPGTALQPFGSVPNQARIWQSDGGREWQDVTPVGLGAASLRRVVALTDASVVAFGSVAAEDVAGMPTLVPRTWTTQDGNSWDQVELLVEGDQVLDLVSGGQGHLVVTRNDAGGTDIWHASQLWDVNRVLGTSFDGRWGSIAAGPEGFVVIQMTLDPEGVTSTILASGDGIEWHEAGSAPSDMQFVAPIGSDWVAVGSGPVEDRSESTTTASWFSANGLEWSVIGQLALEAVGLPGGDGCREFVSDLISAGDVLVASTVLSYPCGEGGVVRFGRSSTTSDGSSWEAFPFAGPIAADTRGTTVNAATPIGDETLLVGERDFQAVFWLLD